MKKMVKLLPLVAIAALMAACGGGKKDLENLQSHKWVLEKVEIADSTNQIEIPANLTMEFSDSSRVSGRGPCNGFFGPYTVGYSSMKFGNLASTMMYCPAMPFETAYHAWLGKVEEFSATTTVLVLKDSKGDFKLYYTVFDPTALEASDFGYEANSGETQMADGEEVASETQSVE